MSRQHQNLSPLRLSVIDVGWPGHLPTLIPELDQLGYHRYWVTEHHSNAQSASPSVLAGIAAGLTKTQRMRIGTAGVLLNFRSPVSIASDFALLELFYPGRIDLGVTSGFSGSQALGQALLDGRPVPTRSSYGARVAALTRLINGDGDDAVSMKSELGPNSRTSPSVWVCGTSMASARLAGQLGLSYAFHDHLKPSDTDGPAVTQSYFDNFEPRIKGQRPELVVAAYGKCDVETDVAELQDQTPMSYRGSAQACANQLRDLGERYGTTEIAIHDLSPTFDRQLRGYKLIAQQLELNL